MSPGQSPKPPTFFTLRERVFGWASVLLFTALFPIFVTWLFVSPRHGLGASWKPAAMSFTTALLIGAALAFVLVGALYSRAKARSRRILAQRDHLACFGCTYDLRGVSIPGRCPECAAAITDADAIRAHWQRQYPVEHAEPAPPGVTR